MTSHQKIIDEALIHKILTKNEKVDPARVREILLRASELSGLDLNDAAILLAVTEQELLQEIFATANRVKEEIYGKRLVIFAPLYISNCCVNECSYCAFCASNQALSRRRLDRDEIAREVETLINQGHHRILLEAGESYPNDDFQYVVDAIATIYQTKNAIGEIRRVNVNVAPVSVEKFKLLKAAGIGTYQLFQETYHPATYQKVHLAGPKADYDWHLTAMDRAMQAGIDDVGIGALFGLYDWRFEVLSMLQHAEYLSREYGVGPHTISVPRLEPAMGSAIASRPLCPVTDSDFCKLVAILRLAVPYTGIIMSTRESPAMRRKTFELGVSQISAGSCTDPGGYAAGKTNSGQFSISDHRTLDEIIADITRLGYIPSFCTACYRLGRTGEDFMCLAKPGKIKAMCGPNALFTFQEYLNHHGSSEVQKLGEQLIQKEIQQLPDPYRGKIVEMLAKIKAGQQDLFV